MPTPLRLLIIEDRPADAELLVAELTRVGFAPEWHRVEGECEYLEHLDPALDLILADYILPQFDAPRALKLLQGRGLDVPFIVVSGVIGEDVVVACLQQGATDYLAKDRLAQLGAKVERALREKALRNESRRAEVALRESEERYRLIAEHINDAIVLVDLEGHVLFANRRAREIVGIGNDDLPAPSLFARLVPDAMAVVACRLAKVRAGQPVPPVFETEIIRKDGSRLWVEASVTSVIKDGTVGARLGVVRDITDRKQGDEAQARLRGQLAQSEKVAAMGQLLAGVAHELNNPLSVVIGQAELFRLTVGDAPGADRVAKIRQAAERCARIVRQFLALAREHPPERRRVELNQVVGEALALIAYPLRVDTITVTRDLAPDVPTIWADPDQLHQVVVNLVVNAHHALRGTPPPRGLRLSTRFDAARGRVSLEVADTGPGIPSDIQSRIFEPFFTTKPAGQGTGLGLSLCQTIVEGHDGTIGVAGALGQGAVFRIELPVTAPSRVEVESLGPSEESLVRGKAILVVDDEPGITKLLFELLALDGHRVDTAGTGVDALARLGERTYDLVLTDLRMPELDGPGLYREVERRQPDLCRRFVFLTGDSLTPETGEFLKHARRPTVSKPFDMAEVRRVVQQALRHG